MVTDKPQPYDLNSFTRDFLLPWKGWYVHSCGA